MIKANPFLTRQNWFFIASVIFVVCLPLSNALVSISGGLLLLSALASFNLKGKSDILNTKKHLIFILLVFFVYLISALFSGDIRNSLYDLRKNIFFLIIPLAFIISDGFSPKQKRYILYIFTFSVLLSAIIAVLRWNTISPNVNFTVHKASLISHIRFSFLILLAFWFLVLVLKENFIVLKRKEIIFHFFTAIFLLGFLFIQQSLTGLFALIGSVIFMLVYQFWSSSQFRRLLLIVLLLILIVSPCIYIYHAIQKFYNFDTIDKNTIQNTTPSGNLYLHNFEDRMVENGHFVYMYICEQELRNEWNKKSEIEYDSISKNGFPISETLIRYLTSKGLRKDSAGVNTLIQSDILNIENGIANVIYTGHRYSIYPRIYQTIWEYYVFTQTGYANYQSFSQRIVFAKAAISIIKKNLWFGVGTSGWKSAFKEEYQKNNRGLPENLYATSHNQYLNYLVKFGLTGFLLILFFIVYPVIITKKYKDTLFLIFLIFIFLANFADSNLETHIGGSFFVFFYCLFISTDNDQYLKIKPIADKFHL